MPLDSSQSFTGRPIQSRDAAGPLPVTRLLSAGLTGPGAAAILSLMVSRR